MSQKISDYPPMRAQDTGLRGKCPRCGQGSLFAGFITVADECENCGLSFDFADAGDGPAFFVICLAVVPVVAFSLWLTLSLGISYWLNALLTLPLLLAVCILPLRPLKGLMIAIQYNKDAHQGERI